MANQRSEAIPESAPMTARLPEHFNRDVVLVLTNLVTVALLVRALWREKFQWHTQMYGMAGYAASLQASSDFRSGKLRLLELSDGGDVKFTGRRTDPFEIWTWPRHRMLGVPQQYAAETFVAFYNRRMKAMQKNPDKHGKRDAERDRDAP